MRPIGSLALALIACCFSSPLLYAQTCCSGGVPLSANIGLPASAKGSWQFTVNYDRNLLKTLKSGDKMLDDDLRERITNSWLFEIGYGLSEKWSLDAFFSVVEQQRTIFSNFGASRTLTRGFGDLVLLLKYNLLGNSSQHDWQVGAGPKIPTGKTDKKGSGGVSLPADLQPGSGSWDMVFWSNFSSSLKLRPSMSYFLTASYRASGENPDYLGAIVYEFGDEFQLIGGITDRYALFSKFLIDPSLSFRYRKAARDVNNEVDIDATGGEWIFIVPGVALNLDAQWSLNASMEWPLYSFVNNTQLTPTNRLTLGVFLKLNKPDLQ